MAELFLAEDTTTGEEVVIKRILPYLSHEPEFVQMFLDEARIAAQLHHPNIIQVHELGKLQDSIFISMEFVDGVDLRKILHEEAKLGLTVPYGIAAYVTAKVAAGLFHAHNTTGVEGRPLGLIHRDVSPQNVMVAFDGRVKLVDFGIAKASALVERSKPGVIKGKFLYLSPEQLSQERIDHRSDLFALGTMLYELTTGKSPFAKPTTEAVIYAIRSEEPPPPALIRSDYPEELSRIVMRCLQKDRTRRYQHASEVQRDLEALLARQFPTDETVLAQYLERLFGAEDESTRVQPGPPSGRAAPEPSIPRGGIATKVSSPRRAPEPAEPASHRTPGPPRPSSTTAPPARKPTSANYPSAGESVDVSVTRPTDALGAPAPRVNEPSITMPARVPPPPPVPDEDEESEETVPLAARAPIVTPVPLRADLEPVFDTTPEPEATAEPDAGRRVHVTNGVTSPRRTRIALLAALVGAAAVTAAALGAWMWIEASPPEPSARPVADAPQPPPEEGAPAPGAPVDRPALAVASATGAEDAGGPVAPTAAEQESAPPVAPAPPTPAVRTVIFAAPRGTLLRVQGEAAAVNKPVEVPLGDVAYSFRCAGKRAEQRRVARVVGDSASTLRITLRCR